MKVAISTIGKNLDAPIDPRFGRCAFFIIVDVDNMKFEVCSNQIIALGASAGIQAAQFLTSKGVQLVITGNMGPNALRSLSAAGIDVITGQAGTVRQVIDDYKKGSLKRTNEGNVYGHYGMGGRSGMDRGMGRGMGRGIRCASGMGEGLMRTSQAVAPTDQSSDSQTKEQELKHLKDQVKVLQKQIEAIESSIKT
jgi:predicted Fe-Mo cluster-binding NifX family protein